MTDERRQDETEEMASLNADALDAGELDEAAMDDVAGGACGHYFCTLLTDA